MKIEKIAYQRRIFFWREILTSYDCHLNTHFISLLVDLLFVFIRKIRTHLFCRSFYLECGHTSAMRPLRITIFLLQILSVKTDRNTGGFLYMKATGIVRRIDDLGRIVIPKEIRRTLRIREGDPLLTTLTVWERYIGAINELERRIVNKD